MSVPRIAPFQHLAAEGKEKEVLDGLDGHCGGENWRRWDVGCL